MFKVNKFMKKVVWTFLLCIINFIFCITDEFRDIDKKETDCIYNFLQIK